MASDLDAGRRDYRPWIGELAPPTLFLAVPAVARYFLMSRAASRESCFTSRFS
jgi:hypothetical protein